MKYILSALTLSLAFTSSSFAGWSESRCELTGKATSVEEIPTLGQKDTAGDPPYGNPITRLIRFKIESRKILRQDMYRKPCPEGEIAFTQTSGVPGDDNGDPSQAKAGQTIKVQYLDWYGDRDGAIDYTLLSPKP